MNAFRTALTTTAIALTAALPGLLAAAPLPDPQVIARGTGETSGVRVEINELKRTGRDFVLLRMTVINDSHADVYADLWQSGLVDLAGRRRYGPLNNGNPVNCLCSGSNVAVAPSARAQVWVRYGAPPSGARSLALELPKFLPIDSVPLSE